MNKTYAIKNATTGKFVKDYSDGKRFTTVIDQVERYTSKKAAIAAAQAYGKENGAGYKVVEL